MLIFSITLALVGSYIKEKLAESDYKKYLKNIEYRRIVVASTIKISKFQDGASLFYIYTAADQVYGGDINIPDNFNVPVCPGKYYVLCSRIDPRIHIFLDDYPYPAKIKIDTMSEKYIIRRLNFCRAKTKEEWEEEGRWDNFESDEDED